MSIVALAAVAAQFIGSPPPLPPPPPNASRATLTEYLTLVVSPEGRVVGCTARLDTRAPVDDRDSCRRLSRSAMQPARDDGGAPIYGLVTVRQGWGGQPSEARSPDIYLTLAQLPGGARPDAVASLTLVVGPGGKTESCAVAQSSGSDVLDRLACRTVHDGRVTVDANYSGPPGRYVRSLLIGFVQQAR